MVWCSWYVGMLWESDFFKTMLDDSLPPTLVYFHDAFQRWGSSMNAPVNALRKGLRLSWWMAQEVFVETWESGWLNRGWALLLRLALRVMPSLSAPGQHLPANSCYQPEPFWGRPHPSRPFEGSQIQKGGHFSEGTRFHFVSSCCWRLEKVDILQTIFPKRVSIIKAFIPFL